MAESFVSCKNLSVGYFDKTLIESIDCTINFNENIGIIGENGSGKTTFLKTLLGIIPPKSGEISINKNCVISYIPQMNEIEDLLPFSVSEIVEMGTYSKISPYSSPFPKYKEKLENVLERTSLLENKNTLFRNLSGGQKQRAILAQALISEPNVIVLDEPTRGLDVAQRARFMQLLKEIKQERGLTIMIVSHILEDFDGMSFYIYSVRNGKLSIFSKPEDVKSSSLRSQIYTG